MKDPVFICGHRKSGTTMFHNLFDGHDELLVYPSDLNLLYAYYPIYVSNEYTNTQRIERLDKVLFIDLKAQLFQAGLDSLLDINKFRSYFFKSLSDDELCNIEIIIRKLMHAYEKTTGKFNRIPVIKETSIEIYAQEIFNWFPNAKFIHLVRDPRDNYAALKAGVKSYYEKLGEDEKITLASLIYRTRIGLQMGLLNRDIYGNKRYLFVNFNELVKNVVSNMHKIADFINIKYTANLIHPTRLGHKVNGNNFNGNKFSEVTDKNVNKWKERISEKEAQIIEFHLGDIMKKFGYVLSYNKSESAKAAAEFYKWQNYKFFFSDRFKNL